VTQSNEFKLVINDNTVASKEFELTRPEIIVGRDTNVDLTIPSPSVSRRHARLMRGWV
jgi:pSer/pThr/pTyr-binding forkhead associated (FHA) protein